MKKALLVDLGNVLVRFDHGKTVQRLAAASGREPEFLRTVLFADLEAFLDEGKITAEDFFREAERRAGLPCLPDSDWIPAWRDIFEPIPEALEALASVRKDVRKALVSNTNALHWEGVLKVAPVDRLVDLLVLSFQVGSRKPGATIFKFALEGLDVTAADAVFLDDRPDFVKAAEQLGIDSFTIQSPDDLWTALTKSGFIA